MDAESSWMLSECQFLDVGDVPLPSIPPPCATSPELEGSLEASRSLSAGKR